MVICTQYQWAKQKEVKVLTPEVRKQIIRGLIETWDYIGSDVLRNIAMEKVGFTKYESMSWEQKQRADESVTIPQADVTCVVRDNWCGKQSENTKVWFTLSDKEKDAIANEAFPHKLYGY